MIEQPEATTLLRATRGGDEEAREKLATPLYDELRRLAASYMKGERAGHTLQPTALVHEAYVRLIDQTAADADRAQFFGLAGHIMRQILIDHARRRNAQKRGGDLNRITLSGADLAGSENAIDFVALDDALARLAAMDERKARLVELRFFGGMSVEEAAAFLDVSKSTAEGDWRVARAWLRRELDQDECRDHEH